MERLFFFYNGTLRAPAIDGKQTFFLKFILTICY